MPSLAPPAVSSLTEVGEEAEDEHGGDGAHHPVGTMTLWPNSFFKKALTNSRSEGFGGEGVDLQKRNCPLPGFTTPMPAPVSMKPGAGV